MNMSGNGVSTRSGRRGRPVVEGEDDVEPWWMRSTSSVMEDDVAFVQGTSRLLDDITASEFLQGYGIDGLPPRFSNFGEFKRVCMQRYEAIADEAMATEYVAFCGVNEEHLALIELRCRQLPSIRILHDARLELLIVKLMVGVPHEWAASTFSDLFKDMVRVRTSSLFHICDMRAARFTVPGVRSKEGDVAFLPSTRDRAGEWPSMVVEVGVSEILGQLRSDATYWLRFSPGHQTRIVILIAVDIVNRKITIERWGHVPPVYPSHLAVPPAMRPRKIQAITIDDGSVNGAPLEIPAGLVFDVLPASVHVDDFEFSAQDLCLFFSIFWRMNRLLSVLCPGPAFLLLDVLEHVVLERTVFEWHLHSEWVFYLIEAMLLLMIEFFALLR